MGAQQSKTGSGRSSTPSSSRAPSSKGIQYPQKNVSQDESSVASGIVCGASFGAVLALGASNPNAVVCAVLGGLNAVTTGLAVTKGKNRRSAKKRHVATGAAAAIIYSAGIVLFVPRHVAQPLLGTLASLAPVWGAKELLTPYIKDAMKHSVVGEIFNSPSTSLSDQVKVCTVVLVGSAASSRPFVRCDCDVPLSSHISFFFIAAVEAYPPLGI